MVFILWLDYFMQKKAFGMQNKNTVTNCTVYGNGAFGISYENSGNVIVNRTIKETSCPES